jgi:CheY-like chemotaxis protein
MNHKKVLLGIRRSLSRRAYVLDLTCRGFEVATADDGLQCLDVLRRFPPDVIVIEPELLWGGGDGVLAVLHESPEWRELPVLVLTTDRNRSAMYSISQFPVNDFWVQPVPPERLTGRVWMLAFPPMNATTAPDRMSVCNLQ